MGLNVDKLRREIGQKRHELEPIHGWDADSLSHGETPRSSYAVPRSQGGFENYAFCSALFAAQRRLAASDILRRAESVTL